MASRDRSQDLSLWDFNNAPDDLRNLFTGSPDWLACLPPGPNSWAVELEFLQAAAGALLHRVERPDGSVVFAGVFPPGASNQLSPFGLSVTETSDSFQHVPGPPGSSRR